MFLIGDPRCAKASALRGVPAPTLLAPLPMSAEAKEGAGKVGADDPAHRQEPAKKEGHGEAPADFRLAPLPGISRVTAPLLICILDGWGESKYHDQYNAIEQARTPCMDALKKTAPRRWRLLKAHGTAVGLPSDAGAHCLLPCLPQIWQAGLDLGRWEQWPLLPFSMRALAGMATGRGGRVATPLRTRHRARQCLTP